MENSKKIGKELNTVKLPKIILGLPSLPRASKKQPLDPCHRTLVFLKINSRISVDLASFRKMEGLDRKWRGGGNKKYNINFNKKSALIHFFLQTDTLFPNYT